MSGLQFFNPNMIYIITWTLTFVLLKLRLTTNIGGTSGSFIFIIFLTVSYALLCLLLTSFNNKKSKAIIKKIELDVCANKRLLNKTAKLTFWSWIFFSGLNLVYIGGFPLINVLLGKYSNYASLGIPSIKGLGDTLYLLSGSFLFIQRKFLGLKFRDTKIRSTIILIFPILMMSRALLIMLGLQVIFIVFISSSFRLRYLIKLLFFIVGFIYLFGVIGDYRGPYYNPFANLISEQGEILNSLPSGFTWLYIYITANFNNILLAEGTFYPNGSFKEIFYNLVPGALKALVFSQKSTDFSPILQNESLNVASMYVGYVSGFGLWGAVIGGITILTIFNYFWFKLLIFPGLRYLMINTILFQCIVLGIFFDSFLTVSTFFQILFVLVVFRYKSNSTKKRLIKNGI